MSISCVSHARTSVQADAVIVFSFSDEKGLKAFSKQLTTDLPHLQPVLSSGDFTGAKLSAVTTYVGSAAKAPRFILVGLGAAADVSVELLRRAAAVGVNRAAALGCTHAAIELPSVKGISEYDVAHAMTEGAVLSQYKFTKYKTTDKTKLVKKTTLITAAENLSEARKGSKDAALVAEGVIVARNLASAPNNEIHPQTLASEARSLGRKHGFSVSILDKKKITELKMGGLLGVNKGSARPPVFIIMEHRGGPKGQKPIVLVGKGVTFDTGGISIKPAAGMSDMKGDMHGAATVIGTMVAAANLGLKRNIVGLVPATDNMPDGNAIVPGDILTFMNGKTAEIDNTDAEGRLILADALCYADRYKPECVIDLATLTGACVVALGFETTGMMGTDDDAKQRLTKAGCRTHERVCELPLYEEYEDLISSDVADIKNSGGRWAGTITAGLFLKHFVSYPWVHLDIAGTANHPKGNYYVTKGQTGVGVRMLTDALRNW